MTIQQKNYKVVSRGFVMQTHLEVPPQVVDGNKAFVGFIEGLEPLDVLVDFVLSEVQVRLCSQLNVQTHLAP
jgi:hypothetical protein